MELDKTALFSLSYGMYALGSVFDGKLNAQIVNTLFQVSAEPPILSVCINKGNLSNEFIKTSKVFSISVLEQKTPMKFIGLLGFRSGRDTDKFKDTKYKKGESGAPLFLEHTLSHIECRVTKVVDAGTHDLFIGKVIAAANVKKGEPLTYAYYHGVKKGTAPASAPVSSEESGDRVNPVAQGAKMQKYVCTVCNYVYDPAKGDPDSGIEPGTPFSDLPDDWVCPVCGVGKDSFKETD